jgi:hypothetical protein
MCYDSAMRVSSLSLAAVLAIAGCGGSSTQYQTQLTPDGELVEIKESGQIGPACQFKAMVEARNLNPGISEYLFNELRNKAAAAGGNAVVIESQSNVYASGRAFACPMPGMAPGTAPATAPTPAPPGDGVPAPAPSAPDAG